MMGSFTTQSEICRRRLGIAVLASALLFGVPPGSIQSAQVTLGANCTASLDKAKELLEQQQPREAREVLQGASVTCAGDAELFDVLGLACDFDHQFDQAQAAYQKALALDPANAAFRNNLASSYLQSGKRAAGIAEFERVLKADPQNSTANVNLGTLYLTEKEYKRAVRFLEAAGAVQSQDPVLLLELMEAYFGAGNAEAARSTAERASRLAGSDPRIHFSLALDLAQQGEYQLAVEQFEAVPSSERDASADLDMGMALSKLGRYGEAHQAYMDAIRQDPSNPDAYLRIGIDALAAGDSLSAVDWLAQAHDKSPQRADIAYALAEGLIATKNFEGARDLLTSALRARPDEPTLLEALGDLSLQQGHPAEAAKAYLGSLKSNPRGASARLSLAKCYMALKENGQAEEELGRVLAIDPRNAEAQAQRGHLALDANQPDVALKWIREALSNDDHNLTASEDYATLMLKQGRATEARTALESLIKLNPNNPRFHYLLGQALVKLGDAGRARAEFELSQKLRAAP